MSKGTETEQGRMSVGEHRRLELPEAVKVGRGREKREKPVEEAPASLDLGNGKSSKSYRKGAERQGR